MGNDQVFAVNTSILHLGSLLLVEIPHTQEGMDLIEQFFKVYARGEGESYLGIDREAVESSDHTVSLEIRRKVEEIAEWIARDSADSDETEKRVRESIWRLTWVW